MPDRSLHIAKLHTRRRWTTLEQHCSAGLCRSCRAELLVSLHQTLQIASMHTQVAAGDSLLNMTAPQNSQEDLAGRSPRVKSPYRTLRIATESQEARAEPAPGMLQLLGHRFGQDYMAGLSTPSTQHQVGPLAQHRVQNINGKAAHVPLFRTRSHEPAPLNC